MLLLFQLQPLRWVAVGFLFYKTVEDKGRTLTLADVQWSDSTQTDGEGNPIIRYTATAKYTGTTSSKYATDYTVSANYTGEVAKTGCDVVTYTATFGSVEAPEGTPDSSQDANASSGAAINFAAVKQPLLIAGLVAAAAIGGVFVFKKIRGRR